MLNRLICERLTYGWAHTIMIESGGPPTMNDITIGLDQADERALACDIPDEALESTAGSQKGGKYTVVFCTALDLCPGP
jgi:hypothetical protein